MNALHEKIYVNCPVGQARRYIDDFFKKNAQLALRVPLQIPGLHTSLLMQREVNARLRRAPAEEDAYDAFTVQWEAVGGGPFPRFDGTVEVKGDEDYDSFCLVLRGSYDPPLGTLGEAFDAVLGRWIAIATARDLLERIRETIEAAYRAQEAGKPHSVASP